MPDVAPLLPSVEYSLNQLNTQVSTYHCDQCVLQHGDYVGYVCYSMCA